MTADLRSVTVLVPGKLHPHAVERIDRTFRMVCIDRNDPALVTADLRDTVRGIAASLEALDQALSMEDTPAGKLEALGRGFVTAVLESQIHIAIFSREEKNLPPEDFERINEMRRDFDRKLTALLRQGVELGEFTLSDPHIAALGIGGMVSWAYVWYRKDGRLSIPEVADELTRIIFAIVQYRPKTAKKSR